MKTSEDTTIDMFARRGDKAVLYHTIFFALLPTAFLLPMFLWSLARHSAPPNDSSIMLTVWIPFCFMTIPPIHYLCRRVKQLEAKLEEITKSQSTQNSA